MQEIFYEETSVVQNGSKEKTKFKLFDIISWIFFLLVPITFFIVFTSYNFDHNLFVGLIIMIVPMVVFLILGIVFGKKKNTFCVDHDYTFISGSIRVSQVIKQYKRKFIIEFETNQIERIGKVGGDTFERYNSMNISKTALTANSEASEGKSIYYFVINAEGKKQLLTMELTERFIVNVVKYTSTRVLDDEYLNELKKKKLWCILIMQPLRAHQGAR